LQYRRYTSNFALLSKTQQHFITSPQLHLINFAVGKFTDLMKTATISPVHKRGNEHLPENYRQTSLLPEFSKLPERNNCDSDELALLPNICLFNLEQDHARNQRIFIKLNRGYSSSLLV
ncbi:unnamed protein product, partial [Callosobruchus maculatus]